jgi:hypothetical protein
VERNVGSFSGVVLKIDLHGWETNRVIRHDGTQQPDTSPKRQGVNSWGDYRPTR